MKSRLICAALAAMASGAAWAQTETGAAAAAASPLRNIGVQGMTLRQIIEYGGWLMYPLFLLSVVGLFMIIYFAWVLREDEVLPRKFVHGLRDLLVGGRFVEAHAACRATDCSISAIMAVALDYRLRTEKPDASVIAELVEGEGARQATLLQNQIQYLVDLSGIAPMIGLLGTVTGMLQAFNAVALDLAKAKPIVLAAGVSQALITTVAGLLIAIPAMIAYAFFRGKTARMIANLETSAADLSGLLLRER